LLKEEWSPEQVSGHLRRTQELAISHETIYRHVWRDLEAGGTLHAHLRCARKQCRKRYGRYDSRGRLAGQRLIGERPASVETRHRTGHWEVDTMMGESLGESSDCILTLVERKSGYVLIGKLHARTAAEANRVLLELLAAASRTSAHDHRGQRNRVPLVWADRSGEPGEVLLCHAAS
jgi:IS30 family transposase